MATRRENHDYSQPSTSTSAMTTTSRLNSSYTEELPVKFNYMNLLEEANIIAGYQNVRQSVIEMDKIIDKAEELIEEVKTPSELYLDAKIIHTMALALEQTTHNVDVGEGVFNLLAFAEQVRLKSLDGYGVPSFKVLAEFMGPESFNSLPAWSPLLGSFEFSTEVEAAKQKKARPARQKDEFVEKKEPEKVSEVEKTQGVEEIVDRIFKILKKSYKENSNKPINFFRFILNPTSFAETVENMFHVGFLINDGHAKLEINSQEVVLISPVLKSGKENSNSENSSQAKERKQNICSIDMNQWRDLIRIMNIKTAMIS